MKKGEAAATKKQYEPPRTVSGAEPQERMGDCPTTSVKFCGQPFSPKKG